MFTHLHVHTEYSPLDGASHLGDLVARASADGQTALAITDHGNVSGAWAFQHECEAAGITPIQGCEVYVAVGSRFEREAIVVASADDSADWDEESERSKTKRYHHLTLLAINRRGWKNLNAMLMDAESHVWSHPRIDMDLLAEHAEGIIVLTGCLGGPVLGSVAQATASAAQAAQAERACADVDWELRRGAQVLTSVRGDVFAAWDAAAAALDPAERKRLVPPAELTSPEQVPEAMRGVAVNVLDWYAERARLDRTAPHPFVDTFAAGRVHRRAAEQWDAYARESLDAIIAAVGRDNVYVEIMEHGIAEESVAVARVAELAAEYGLPLVATNDSHYTDAADAHTHEAILAMQSKKTLDDPKRFQFHGEGYHLRTEAEMRSLRPEPWWQQACDNTNEVAARIRPRVLPPVRMRLPAYPVPDGFDSEIDYLTHLVYEGARRIYGDQLPGAVVERIEHELSVIGQMGFPAYFLIVREMIQWAKDHRIIVGPGRGSAAGAMVSYCLGIVTIDPLRHNLLFERFLEPGRKGMPDIDTDFEKARFDEVYDWAQQRYGLDSVARIGTFAIATTKRAIKDSARVMHENGLGDRLSKAVPTVEGKPYSFARLEDTTDHRGDKFRTEVAKAGQRGTAIVDLAKEYADTIAGVGVHACGVIISAKPLVGSVPLRLDAKEFKNGRRVLVTQWTGPELEDLGLLKMDMLRIRNLDVISKAIEYVETTRDEVIDYYHLPDPDTRDDPKVARAWQLLREGRTAGIFQMDSDGMRRLAQAVQPTEHNDLTAILALYRPGPMGAGMHDTYARRKSGEEPVDYTYLTDDPEEARWIDSVLGTTYGVFVYQEDLMRLGTVVAGFDAAMRSKLRKAVGKKKKALLDEVFTALREGAAKEFRDDNGDVYSPKFQASTVEHLIDAMQGAAAYLFNKSHAAAYAQVTFNTAYLKANWPAEYGAAILACTDDDDKRLTAIRSLQEEGIEILPADVNLSGAETAPVGETSIRFGLTEIKGVGSAGALLAEHRPRDGWTSLAHIVSVLGSKVNVGVLEALIEAGALDQLGPRLGHLTIVRALSVGDDIPVPDIDFDLLEASIRQRRTLGVALGTSPLYHHRRQIKQWSVPGIEDSRGAQLGTRPMPLHRIPDAQGARVLVAAVLAQASERAYSKGQMLQVTLEGSHGTMRATMWAEDLARQHASDGVPPAGSIVAVSGRVRVREVEVTDETGEVTSVELVKELTIQHMWRINVHDDDRPAEPRLSVDDFAHAFALMNHYRLDRYRDLPAELRAQQPEQTQRMLEPLRKRPVITAVVCPECGRHRYLTGTAPTRCTMTIGCTGRPEKASASTRLAPSEIVPAKPEGAADAEDPTDRDGADAGVAVEPAAPTPVRRAPAARAGGIRGLGRKG